VRCVPLVRGSIRAVAQVRQVTKVAGTLISSVKVSVTLTSAEVIDLAGSVD